MDDQHYPDPFTDAIHHGIQRAVQIGSCALTAAQAYRYYQRTQANVIAERDDRARRALNAQLQAEKEADRARWAPALDPQWLRQATFTDTAAAWGAAMPYADRAVPWYEPAAATALRKSEDRLRDLHPYAMARYDRLRDNGLGPAEAMREAAPLFARHPHAHDAPSEARRALAAGTGEGLQLAADDQAHMAERTRAADLSASDVTATAGLDERTQGLASAHTGAAAAAEARGRAARTARPWEHDFPLPIREAVAHATAGQSSGKHAAIPRRTAVPVPGRPSVRQA